MGWHREVLERAGLLAGTSPIGVSHWMRALLVDAPPGPVELTLGQDHYASLQVNAVVPRLLKDFAAGCGKSVSLSVSAVGEPDLVGLRPGPSVHVPLHAVRDDTALLSYLLLRTPTLGLDPVGARSVMWQVADACTIPVLFGVEALPGESDTRAKDLVTTWEGAVEGELLGDVDEVVVTLIRQGMSLARAVEAAEFIVA